MNHTPLFLAYLAIAGTVANVFAPPAPEAQASTPEPVVEAVEAPRPEPEPEPVAIAAPAPEKSQRDLNKEYLVVYGTAAFGEAEIPALLTLVQKESGFRNDAQNPRSTAYGMFQFLNATWTNYGYEKTSDPITQIEAGLKYIKARYGTPSKALNFHKANNWY